MTSPNETMEKLNAHNAGIPFNVWLGLEVLAAREDSVELRVPWRAEFSGAPGMTHGGVIASIVDAAAFLVLIAVRGSAGPTVDMRVDFHRSTANTMLYVKSALVRAGATISSVEVQIHDSERRLIASGRSVMISEPRICSVPLNLQ
jgi:uncharacterized protein (TIGR00369 family)